MAANTGALAPSWGLPDSAAATSLCGFLYSSELVPANLMPKVARPETDKTLAKALSPIVVGDLVDGLAEEDTARRDAWALRDQALVLTALLTGLLLD